MFSKSLLLLLFIPSFLQAQQGNPFKITGKSAYYKDSNLVIQVGVFPVTYNSYTLANAQSDSPRLPGKMIRNEEIELAGTMLYPHPFFASYYDSENNIGHNSEYYFLDGGDAVTITVDNLSSNHSLGKNINTKSNQEYQRLKKLYGKTVDSLTGKIVDMQAKQQVLKAYIKDHPNSYVALWVLALDFPYIQNDSENQSILANTKLFSAQVKQSNTYQRLVENVRKRLVLSVGTSFPDIELAPAVSLKEAVKQNKFTLIDFWYSHCQPCLKQLPDLKNLFTDYKTAGFSIIGVSVDKKEHEEDWRRVIQQFNLSWSQYLDMGGKEARNLGIDSYPTNFLVDEKGVIIKKDISPGELKEFLEKELK